jgi:serine/threonine protein kinase
MSHLIDAVTYLHSRGIVHRDLVLRNLLLSEDPTKSIVIADLQTRWGSGPCLAPECWEQQNFTFASDVYAIGKCLMEFTVMPTPRHQFVKYTVPAPFDVIHAACSAEDPEKRPSLEELRIMVNNIID